MFNHSRYGRIICRLRPHAAVRPRVEHRWSMALASLGPEAVVALTNSKQEFDARTSEWMSKLALTHEPPYSSELPSLQLAKSISKSNATSVSFSSKRSSASCKISFKLLQAKAKLRIAQLEAQHEEERAKEEQLLKRRETQRKIALAESLRRSDGRFC